LLASQPACTRGKESWNVFPLDAAEFNTTISAPHSVAARRAQ
jgi:hypothetical protein